MKILLVEDSSFKRKALAYVIERHGHEVIVAIDGVEGLEKTRAYMPDIIISDLLMPRMDGFQFIRNIKKDEQLMAIPIIVFSSTYKEEKERELALSLGAFGFIEDVGKPDLLWQELQRMIEGWLCKEEKVCKPIIEDDLEFLMEHTPIIQAKLEKKIRELEEEVDKRNRVEEALKAKELLLSESQRIAHIGGWSWDLTGSIRWTDETYRVYGVSPDTFTPTIESLVNLLHPDDRSAMQEWVRACSAGEKPGDLKFRSVLPDGAIRFLNGRGELFYDAENKPVRITGTVQNITDLKLAQEEVKTINEELLTINRIITTSVNTLDTKEMLDKILVEALNIVGLEGGTICMFEPDDSLRLVTQRGSSEATITDLTTNRIKVGDCLCGNCAQDQCPLILRDREAVMKYATREALRGEAINFHAAFPFISKGRSVGVLCVFTRTDKKPGERKLKLLETLTSQVALAIENAMFNEKIQQDAIDLEQKVKERTAQLLAANKELESFSYSVSHDLRAPLRAISGFAEIIVDRYRSGLNEEGRHYLDNIVVAGTRMGHLIDDLLAYARLGRITVRHEPVPLRSIFDIVASDLAIRLTETGGTLKIADALPTVMGDKTLLGRMFTNLVENALIYRKSDVPPQVEVTYQIKNGRVIVKVSDNGIGIPSEYYEKIFNIFQRLHSDEEHPGTGIGLAIVKKAAELLGGSVRVESEVGKGSMFLIELQRSEI